VLVRLPRAFSRPAPAVAARAETKTPARRRPPTIVAPPPTPIVQPVATPPPPEPALVPAAVEEPTEIPEAAEDTASAAGEATLEVPARAGVVGGTGSALELGQVAHPPVLLTQAKPEYPRAARFDRIEGRVVLRAVIGVDGRIEEDEVSVLHSIPALDGAAIAALRAWRFSPGSDAAGNAVRVVIEIPFEFSLR
jgi:protein TonB